MASPGREAGRAEAQRAVLTLVALASALIPLNSTMIAVALPRVVDELGGGLRAASWLVSGYLIVMASLQPLAGKVGDRVGRRPLLLGGLATFGLASAAAAAAPSLGLLIACRSLQALGAAILFPNAIALLREQLPTERRGRSFGLMGAVAGLAAAVGLPLGGLLVALTGWEGIFLVNLPLVALALALAWSLAAPAPDRPSARFDLLGAGMLCAALMGLAAVIESLRALGFAGTVACAGALAALLTLFVRRELRHPDPVLQPRFFRRAAFSVATAATAAGNLAMYAVLLAVPVVFSHAAGWSNERIGLMLVPFALAMVVLSPVGGRLADRVGRPPIAVAGSALFAAGLVPLAAGGADLPDVAFALTLALAGAGFGLATPALQTAAIEALEARHAGVASGVFSTSRYLGSIIAAGALALAAEGKAATLFWVAAAAAGASAALAGGLGGVRLRGRAPRLHTTPTETEVASPGS